MDGQLIIVVALVTLAVGYVARQTWREWAGTKKGGCGGCKCGPAKTPGANGLIQLSVRNRDT